MEINFNIPPPDPSISNKIFSNDKPLKDLSKRISKNDACGSKAKLRHSMIPMANDDPFKDTDLVIFKDSYKGLMPLNGIKESEFKALKDYYSKLEAGKTKFKINESYADDPLFKAHCQDMIKNLLTRQLGRDLISDLENCSEIPEINLVFDDGSSHHLGSNNVYFNPMKMSEYTSIDALGNKITIEKPPFITLAHELTHLLHDSTGRFQKVTEKPTLSLVSEEAEFAFDNLEEQYTITGLLYPLKFEERASASSNESDFFNDFEPREEGGYDRFNENNFLSVYSTGSRPLLPRINHRGGVLGFLSSSSNPKKSIDMTLAEAVRSSDAVVVKQLLSNPDHEKIGLEILHLAFNNFVNGSKRNSENNAIILRKLINHSPDEATKKLKLTDFFSKTNSIGETILESAWAKQDSAQLKNLLLIAPNDVKEQFYKKIGLLELIAEGDFEKDDPLVISIIQNGPDGFVNALYERAFLSPGIASWHLMLLEHVEELNPKDANGSPFLNRFLLSNVSSEEKYKKLEILFKFSDKINKEATDQEGNNFLHIFCRTDIEPEIVELLPMRNKKILAMKNNDGLTPVQLANSLGKDEVAEWFDL